MTAIALAIVAVAGITTVLCVPTLCVAALRGQMRTVIRTGLMIAVCAIMTAALGCYLSIAAGLALVR